MQQRVHNGKKQRVEHVVEQRCANVLDQGNQLAVDRSVAAVNQVLEVQQDAADVVVVGVNGKHNGGNCRCGGGASCGGVGVRCGGRVAPQNNLLQRVNCGNLLRLGGLNNVLQNVQRLETEPMCVRVCKRGSPNRGDKGRDGEVFACLQGCRGQLVACVQGRRCQVVAVLQASLNDLRRLRRLCSLACNDLLEGQDLFASVLQVQDENKGVQLRVQRGRFGDRADGVGVRSGVVQDAQDSVQADLCQVGLGEQLFQVRGANQAVALSLDGLNRFGLSLDEGLVVCAGYGVVAKLRHVRNQQKCADLSGHHHLFCGRS